ncbi:hypothetical protein BD410DRAFT_310598 [Rickenella mellea]|uniref:G-protein coupled receptors family 1 profile domain-containing protein n=1 Tax=Rickenella mellea TaxID=50990 RepID=A0A4Y7Q328_9AGAM|nr:hypothetical protein BD410DRAFT_310598 [Rickenella mellea]
MLIYVLFFADDAQVCVTTFRALGYVTSAAINVAQWILILRTYAVWGSKKDKRFFSLFTVYLGTLAIDHWACHRYQMGVHSNGVPAPAMTGCTLFFENRFAWVSFVLIIIVESALIGLLAFKAVEYFRFGGGSLMSVIYHDGLLYFACILATSIANLVVVLVAPAELHPFLIVAQRVLHSLLCSRILLRIRAAYQAQTLKGFDSIWIADTSPNQRATYNDEIGNIQFIDSETTTPTTV